MVRDSSWSAPAYYEEIHEDAPVAMADPTDVIAEVFATIPGDTWKAKLDHCASCQCCPRHQANKPRTFVHWSESFTKAHVPNNGCECSCRHKARWLCRQAPGLPAVEDRV